MATLRFTVADDDAGSRLDRALAARPEIGTRSLAEQLVVAGAVTVDGAVRPKSHRLEHGSVVVVELPAPAAGLVAEPVTVRLAYEDEHLVVVDKPAGIAVHPGAGTSAGTLAAQLLTLGAVGGHDPDRPGNRPSARPRHVGAARRRALRGGVRRAAGGDPAPRGRAPLPRARARDARGRARDGSTPPIGRDRRDPDEAVARHRRAARRGHAGSRSSRRSPSTRCSTCGSRRGGRIRSACISRRSTCPSPAIPSYGVKGDLGLERQFLHAHRLRFVHPVTGEELDARVAAAGRSRRGARARRPPCDTVSQGQCRGS